MFIIAHTPTQIVELIALVGFTITGLSHIFQPKTWVTYFSNLHSQGSNGVITSIMGLQFWPAVAIVVMHQVWSGYGIALTLYGWLLLGKCTMALLFPQRGLNGLAMAEKHGERGFVIAGYGLLILAALCAAALYFTTAG